MTSSATLSPSSPSKSSLSSLLSAAVRLWLRSQVEAAETLKIEFSGKNRQLLRGEIPSLDVEAAGVIYQGLHLGQVWLQAGAVRLNLKQLLKGEPLRLLQPVPVQLRLTLHERDLTASLNSPLLQQASHEVFQGILPNEIDWSQVKIQLQGDRLHLITPSPQGIHLSTHLAVHRKDNHHAIQLQELQVQRDGDPCIQTFPPRNIPLDATVSIDGLTCHDGLLHLSGNLQAQM
ncbi:DUF2993 domain-containing protein [Phormidium yuhuli AB48]|uniref:DUF2993 domain-containing protein n=1 Tax=Phormidium yuhuli AB48 TaxID=2940671 RepID=A0ABY5ATG8_9CYAN|nr:DUF2993 domain-containing protein [Phormidium yuhuli]USR91539.1 DUF2993 domain-containing protein [Phormidium yuhuli AB48]